MTVNIELSPTTAFVAGIAVGIIILQGVMLFIRSQLKKVVDSAREFRKLIEESKKKEAEEELDK